MNVKETLSQRDDRIKQLNKAGLTIPKIIDTLIEEYPKITYAIVALTLSRNEIKANKSKMPKRKEYSENYFEIIDNHDKSYFFGLICADGGVCDKIGRLRISLKSTDGYLIEIFGKQICSNLKIGKFKPSNGSEQTNIQVYSKKMVDDLMKLGCLPKKSLTMQMPNIPKEYFWSFMRGYFDGDGWITISETKRISYKQAGIIGSIPFLKHINLLLKDLYGINSCFHIPKGKEFATLTISKQSHVLLFRNLMYKDGLVHMKRKFNAFYSEINTGVVYERNNHNSIIWHLN